MIDQFSQIAGRIYNPVTNLIDRMAEWKQLKNDVHTKLRLFYLECRRNLALLEALDLDPEHDEIRTNDEDYLNLAACLEIEVLEMIFFEGKKNNKFLRLLQKKVDIKLPPQEKQPDEKEETNLIKRAVYLYIRIDILQKLAKLPDKGKALRSIRYRTRLRHIKSSLHYIVKILSEHKIIKELLEE